MIRVYADFNAKTPSGDCFILWYGSLDLSDQIPALNLSRGDKVLLYQDDDDFEVMATLNFGYIDILARNAWYATPDWSTLVRKGEAGGAIEVRSEGLTHCLAVSL